MLCHLKWKKLNFSTKCSQLINLHIISFINFLKLFLYLFSPFFSRHYEMMDHMEKMHLKRAIARCFVPVIGHSINVLPRNEKWKWVQEMRDPLVQCTSLLADLGRNIYFQSMVSGWGPMAAANCYIFSIRREGVFWALIKIARILYLQCWF